MGSVDSILGHAASAASKAAIVTPEASRTYGQLEERASRIASGLDELGLKPLDPVAVMVPNSLESIETTLAVLGGGFVHVAVNILFKEYELTQVLTDSAARAIVVDSERADLVAGLRDSLPNLDFVIVAGDGPGDRSFEELLSSPPSWPTPVKMGDPAAVLYTGGTTGAPKGVLHDHRNLAAQLSLMIEYYELTSDDSALGGLPTFLMPPLMAVHLNTLAVGGTLHMMPRFDAAEALRIMVEEKVTFMAGSKTMCWLFNQLPANGEEDLSGMKSLSWGGMYQPGEVRREFEQRFGVSTLHVYGMSEGVNLVAGTPRHLPEAMHLEKFESVGKGLSGIEIAALDADSRPQPAGESGEICVRPRSDGSWRPMLRYINRDEETKAALREGWYHSGDFGYVDQDGFAYVLGRAQEMIKVSGWSVFPSEIEAVIAENPGVEEVAVVGVPDPKSGEKPFAYVTLVPGEEVEISALEEAVAARLAPFKRLSGAAVIDELPKNVYGKIQKQQLGPPPKARLCPCASRAG